MANALGAIEDVHFRYETTRGREILRGVAFELFPGERVALLGASGSGKSTLLSLVGLLNVPDAGTIVFDGTVTGKLSEAERCALRAARLGFVFQHHFLLPELTARENVELAARLAGPHRTEGAAPPAATSELLDRLGLTDRADAYPRQLSGGEQQRVALARALVNRPALVLADEPTGNLDSASGAAVLDVMGELQHECGTALLIATHDLDVAATCTRRLTIRDGALST